MFFQSVRILNTYRYKNIIHMFEFRNLILSQILIFVCIKFKYVKFQYAAEQIQ